MSSLQEHGSTFEVLTLSWNNLCRTGADVIGSELSGSSYMLRLLQFMTHAQSLSLEWLKLSPPGALVNLWDRKEGVSPCICHQTLETPLQFAVSLIAMLIKFSLVLAEKEIAAWIGVGREPAQFFCLFLIYTSFLFLLSPLQLASSVFSR